MLAPLREKNFRWYWFADLVNQAGSLMNSVALAFAVLELGGSASMLGAVLAAHSIPTVALLLAGGVIADRFGRTVVIQVCNVGAGLTQLAIAVLVITGEASFGAILALTAVNGVFAGAGFPALAALVPQLVPRDQLQPANALMSLQRNALRVVAPAVAGLLVVTVGAGWALVVDGVSYLASAALIILVRIPPAPPGDEPESMVAQLRQGWQFVRGTTWLWVVVLGFTALNALMVGAISTLGPVLASRSSIGASGWGLLLSAEAAGLLIMAVVLLRVRLERPLLLGMAAIALVGVHMIVLGSTAHLAVLLGTALLAGLGSEVFGIGWSLAMQEHVPDHLLSRAYSYDALGSFVAVPIGQLAAGPIALLAGLRPAIVVAGVLYVLICLLTLCSPAVRALRRQSRTRDPHGRDLERQ